jgi:hypothetical protein
VRVSAENSLGLLKAGVGQGSRGDFLGEPEPADMQAIYVARQALALEIEFLQLQVKKRPEVA